MAFSYTGNPGNVNINNAYTLPSLPSDGDQAAATTVTSPLSIAADELHYLAKQFSCYRPHVSMFTLNSTTIRINPFNSVSIFNGSKWFFLSSTVPIDITAANLEGGGALAARWYYVYLKDQGTFVISPDQPDPTLIFKNSLIANATQFRYFGSFYTDGASFTLFSMVDFDYTFNFPVGTSPLGNITSAFGTVTVINVPGTGTLPTIRVAKVVATLGNTKTQGAPNEGGFYFGVGPEGSNLAGAGYPGQYVPPRFSIITGIEYSPFTREVPVNPTTFRIQAGLFNPEPTADASLSICNVFCNGYKE